MTRQAFIPLPIPPSSRALVDTLKRRLTQAVEVGHARDARIYLSIIERLARMQWLDDTLLVEAQEAERVRTAQAIASVKRRMAQQDGDAAQPAQPTQPAQQPQKASAPAAARMAVLSKSPFPWEQKGQALPASSDIDAPIALETKRSDPTPARMTSCNTLRSSVRLPPQTR